MQINTVAVSGNLTRDPELRVTPNGTGVLTFSLAHNSRENVNGEWRNRPHYFDCVMFGSRCEWYSNALSKGMHVTVEGSLKYDSWDGKDGKKRTKVSIVCKNLDFDAPKANANATQMHTANSEENQNSLSAYDTDDIPF